MDNLGIRNWAPAIPGADTAFQSLVTAPPNGQPAMSAAGVGFRGAIMQGMRLEGTKGAASGASTALVLNASRLQVRHTGRYRNSRSTAGL